MAERPQKATGSGGGAPGRLDGPRLEALKKQFRHPYITGQGLEPPQGPDGQQPGQDESEQDPATSDRSPDDLSDTTNQ